MAASAEVERLQAAQAAIKAGLVGSGDDDPRAVMLISWPQVQAAMSALTAAFERHRESPRDSPRFLHCFAAKANPIGKLLQKIHAEGQMGVEAASMAELCSALLGACIPSEFLVFDSPVKTRAELKFALQHHVFVNIDNFQELQRVKELLLELAVDPTKLRLGLRINPQVGAGSLLGFSTGCAVSKFGIPLEERSSIIQAYRECPWMNAMHVHAGSQGMSFALQVAAIRAIVDLALEINSQAQRPQVHIIDIGGGLSVNFRSDAVTPTFDEYATALQQGVPELFAAHSPFSLIVTEFGRSVLAKAGCIMSTVEYTKTSGGRHIAALHTGGDLLLRTVYLPDQWPLRVQLLDVQCAPVVV
jgi:diaminopimelate decarboxylase